MQELERRCSAKLEASFRQAIDGGVHVHGPLLASVCPSPRRQTQSEAAEGGGYYLKALLGGCFRLNFRDRSGQNSFKILTDMSTATWIAVPDNSLETDRLSA